ncbi:GDSL-type esterase/lipase family protein [Lentzea kentuckyensis]|uniref:GDSL-type esterase/lipase family protein n=1 Tax=Lentzea kentuckyensis TaxID=360086 RepID=UPI001B8051F4|nr:SGNH/GDSL hydrolase family protein [Lentzea kentuckyensis]
MSRKRTRGLITGVAATMFAAGLMTAPGPVAAAADVPTTDSQTLVYLTSGFGQGIVLCANPDDTSLWIGEQEDADAYCQWEQIGDDGQFTLFNPAKGMVLTGVGADHPLVMDELVFPADKAQTQSFSWGEAKEGGRALRWNGDQSQNVDAGSGAKPSADALGLSAWRDQVEQTWNVQNAGPSTRSAKARSTSAVRVTSSQWSNRFLCAVVGDGIPDNGRVKLSDDVQDNACEWLPFGPKDGPFVLYNPEYGKVITLNGGAGGPLVMGDKTYPNDKRELWAFNPKQVLVWAGDRNQAVDAGAKAPAKGPVSTRTWDPNNPGPFVWTFITAEHPTAVVTLGDSFMSGEGGRWKGNSNNFSGTNDGTDRAYVGTFSFDDPKLVYGASYKNGCNRSNSAEPHSSNAYDVQINLACSGAKTENIYLTGYKGEAPQADQLATVAAKYDVRLIALSIGGNDLGFSGVIKACVNAYVFKQGTCWNEQQKNIIGKLGTTRDNVVNALNAIRTAMEKAGYRDPAHYRIVLQSAPSPLPRSKDIRYPEDNDRTLVGGCPFWNDDADWARDKLTPEISNMLKSAAEIAKVGFLDLQSALDGREVCNKASQLVNSTTKPPKGTIHEWARFLVSGATQGQRQESLHPSYFGQRALGRCLALYNENLFAQASCTNTPKQEPERMVLTEIEP